MNSQHIVKFYNRIIDKERYKVHLILEYCSGMDLSILIKKSIASNKKIKEKFIWKCLRAILLALSECRKANVIHRDIKPANILICQDTIKLTDFGLATKTSYDKDDIVGSPVYKAPETHDNPDNDSELSDIWSLGITIFELASSKLPFAGSNLDELQRNILTGRVGRLPDKYSNDLNDLVQGMLQVDINKRLTLDTLLEIVSKR